MISGVRARAEFSFIFKFYLILWSLLARVVAPKLGRPARTKIDMPGDAEFTFSRTSRSRLVWFHAASAGELESLWTVAEEWVRAGGVTVLTCFSPSAAAPLARLTAQLRALHPDAVLYSGYAPWEDQWHESIGRFARSDFDFVSFVTVKYEVWPALWDALARNDVTLMLISARLRPSLTWGLWVLNLLGGQRPPLKLIAHLDADADQLEGYFGAGAHIERGSDPRWDRVDARLEAAQLARVGVKARSKSPQIILGSAWASDIAAWGSTLGLAAQSAHVRVYPHTLDEPHYGELLRAIRALGISTVVSSGSEERGSVEFGQVTVVAEYGRLAEAYADADLAYVGGGFEKGIHSTLEPAMSGLEIWCGPKRANRFAEILWLRAEGVLKVVSETPEAENSIGSLWQSWIAERATGNDDSWQSRRRGIRQKVLRQCGGTHFVFDLLQRLEHRA